MFFLHDREQKRTSFCSRNNRKNRRALPGDRVKCLLQGCSLIGGSIVMLDQQSGLDLGASGDQIGHWRVFLGEHQDELVAPQQHHGGDVGACMGE